MSGGDQTSEVPGGMSKAGALRLEMFIIGLGLFGLVLIFQPLSITLFGIGSAVVVLAGLVNNLLPMAQPGVRVRSVLTIGLVVAMIFCIVLLLSISAAHLYGVFFLSPPATAVPSAPFYQEPFVWGIAAAAAGLAVMITWLNATDKAA